MILLIGVTYDPSNRSQDDILGYVRTFLLYLNTIPLIITISCDISPRCGDGSLLILRYTSVFLQWSTIASLVCLIAKRKYKSVNV